MSDLSELLLSRLPEGWTWRRAAREAEKRGIQLSTATVTAYLGGRHGQPSEPVLSSFAELFDIPLSQLRKAAGVATGEDEPYRPPAEASRLTQRQRHALDELIRSFVSAQSAVAPEADAGADIVAPGMVIQLKTSGFQPRGEGGAAAQDARLNLLRHVRALQQIPGVTAADWAATMERFAEEFGPISDGPSEPGTTVSEAR